MKNFQTILLCSLLFACHAQEQRTDPVSKSEPPVPSATSSKNALAKYQYVGTYESFSTPMGSSVSVLMSKGKKIKLASVDATNYINIDIQQGIPAMMIDGTYGINGNHKKSATGSDNLFVVREIEYLGGGRKSNLAHTRSWLPDFFEVNARGTGPLTRSELNIQFPDALTRYFDDDNLECFYQQVDIRAADMGDPQTMPPIRRVVLTNEKMRWNEMTDADKRLQLARYVTSMALGDC